MKELEKILDIEPYEVQVADAPKVVPEDSAEPEDTDYKFVRQNYYEIIQQGSMALSQALRVATESDHPRAFEVVSGLMKNLADVNRQLLMTGEDRQKVKAARKGNIGTAGQQPQQVTNNTAVFVGSSADLSKLVREKLNSDTK